MSESGNLIQVIVELRPDHIIFKGHFPGQPVLPGVCMMEMIREISSDYYKQSFRIRSAPMIKFLQLIDPQKNPLIHLEIKFESNSSNVAANGKIFFDKETFMKFQIHLQR